jgi:hypothetical protein
MVSYYVSLLAFTYFQFFEETVSFYFKLTLTDLRGSFFRYYSHSFCFFDHN